MHNKSKSVIGCDTMPFRSILVVKMSAIGDVIHALPVSYALKESFPGAKVSWVVEKAAHDLLVNNPYIDQIILFEKHKFKSIGGLINHLPSFSRFLREQQFDAALDLQGLAKSAAVAFFSGAPTKLGVCDMRELSHWVSRPVCGPHHKEHIVERYLDVARAMGCKVHKVVFPLVITDEEAQGADKIIRQAGLSPQSPYVVLAPGANWPNKRWPARHMARLCDTIYGWRQVPVLIGGPGDRPLAEDILSQAEIPPVDLIGKTSLKQLAAVIKGAKAFVGGDTGPMHLAAGIGTPTLALMGPTDANRNGPYGKVHIALEVPRDCAGCWQRQCPKQLDCLDAFPPEQISRELADLLLKNR